MVGARSARPQREHPGPRQHVAPTRIRKNWSPATLPPVAGRRLHRPGQGRRLGGERAGLEGRDRVPPAQGGPRGGDDAVGKRELVKEGVSMDPKELLPAENPGASYRGG